METRTLKAIGKDKEFDFDPSAKTVSFKFDIDQSQIVIIINLTKGTSSNITLYNFGCEGLGGTLFGNVLTLELDTTSMLSSDDLVVIVEDRQITDLLLDNNTALKCLKAILESQEETNKWLRKIYNPE